MRALLPVAVATLAVAGCGGSPVQSSYVTYTLSGRVSGGSAPIAGAVVAVLDGSNAGQKTTTSGNGGYSLDRLRAGNFNIKVSAAEYADTARGVSLAANVSVNVELLPYPKALLDDAVAPIDWDEADVAPGNFVFYYKGINKGVGCAGSVAGTTEYRDAQQNLIGSFTWSLSSQRPPMAIIPPGQMFGYWVCCLTKDQASRALLPTSSYRTRFSWVDVACS
jgi:hypothetical protein